MIKKYQKYLFFIIILLFIKNVYSQNPVDFTATCEKYSGDSTCKNFLLNPDSIYVSSTWTQSDAQNYIDQLLGSIESFPAVCKSNHTFRLICNQYFQPCVPVPLDGSYNSEVNVNLNKRVCRKDCTQGNSDCGTTESCTNSYDSSQAGVIFKFPLSANNYNLSTFGGPNNYVLDCLDVDTLNGTGEVHAVCYPPLIRREPSSDRDKDIEYGWTYLSTLNCLLPCPAPFFTTHQWKIFQNLTSVMGIFSFIAVFFNVFTYGVLIKKYDRHSIGIMFLSFSLLMCQTSDMILIALGWSVSCPEPGRTARMHDRSCAANGILFQYGAVSTVLWWSTMAFDLWLVIRKVRPSVSFVKYYIIIINILSVVFTIGPIIGGEIGYGSGGIGCWILSNKYQNAFFWIPLTVCLFIGTSFIILIIYEITKIVRNVGSGNSRIFHLNLRPFLIILFIFCEYLYLFIYHFYVETKYDSFIENITEYVMCIQTLGKDCETHTVSFGGQFVFLLFLRLLGVEVLIFYGINARTKRIWKQSALLNNKYSLFIKSKLESLTITTSKANTNTNSTNSKPETTNSNQNSNLNSGNTQDSSNIQDSMMSSEDIDSDSDSDDGGGINSPGISIGKFRSVNVNLSESNRGGVTWRPASRSSSWKKTKDQSKK